MGLKSAVRIKAPTMEPVLLGGSEGIVSGGTMDDEPVLRGGFEGIGTLSDEPALFGGFEGTVSGDEREIETQT